jgi:hypothetical protein
MVLSSFEVEVVSPKIPSIVALRFEITSFPNSGPHLDLLQSNSHSTMNCHWFVSELALVAGLSFFAFLAGGSEEEDLVEV